MSSVHVTRTIQNGARMQACWPVVPSLSLAGLGHARQERIEKSGPLGKADVASKELDLVEQQLRGSMKASQPPDGLCMYLLGVICAER